MSKISRTQVYYDDELRAQNLARVYRPESVQTGNTITAIYREIVVDLSSLDDNRTPWWKRKKTTSKRKS